MKQDLYAPISNKPLWGWENLKVDHTGRGIPRVSRLIDARYAEGARNPMKGRHPLHGVGSLLESLLSNNTLSHMQVVGGLLIILYRAGKSYERSVLITNCLYGMHLSLPDGNLGKPQNPFVYQNQKRIKRDRSTNTVILFFLNTLTRGPSS